jgi:hypothetical protein
MLPLYSYVYGASLPVLLSSPVRLGPGFLTPVHHPPSRAQEYLIYLSQCKKIARGPAAHLPPPSPKQENGPLSHLITM